jgi:hypothetical protein
MASRSRPTARARARARARTEVVRGAAWAALILGCSCATTGDPAGRPPPSMPAELRALGSSVAWVQAGLRPIRAPEAVGGVAVGIVSTPDRELLVVGLDPATGAKLWQQPTTPSRVTRGVVVRIEKVGDDKIAYLRPTRDDGAHAELVVADARTGKDLARSPEAIFKGFPAACAGSTDLCVTSRLSSNGVRRQYRLEIAGGRHVANSVELPRGARPLYKADLHDLSDPDRSLGLIRDGKLRWSKRTRAVFPRQGSSDNGWLWRLFRGVFVGSAYGDPTREGSSWRRDTSHAATAGLSEATGELLWRDEGSRLDCLYYEAEHVPVRCRIRGIVTLRPDLPPSVEGLAVAIEGFDPATGQTTWSMMLGAEARLATRDPPPPIAGPTHIVVAASTGPIVLDYASGETRVPVPEEAFWCRTPTTYELAIPYRRPDGTEGYSRPGGALAFACDAQGQPAATMPALAATIAAGAHIGDHAVLATKGGYVGFKVR